MRGFFVLYWYRFINAYCKINGFCPQLGNNLGELTDEIDAKKGNYIKELILVAPKSYAYETDIGYRHALRKRITFNNLAALKINLDSMKEIVLEDKCKKTKLSNFSLFVIKKVEYENSSRN